MIHNAGGHICMTSIKYKNESVRFGVVGIAWKIDFNRLEKKVQKQSIRPELYGHCGQITFLLCGIFMGACMPWNIKPKIPFKVDKNKHWSKC